MSIRCSLGMGCDETGICYAMAHGQPDQCGVNIVDDNPVDVLEGLARQLAGTLGLGVDETSFARAREYVGAPQPAGIDLSLIKPLTEEEAEAYFNAPTAADKYREAMEFLAGTYEHQHEAIAAYVEILKERIGAAYKSGFEDARNGGTW